MIMEEAQRARFDVQTQLALVDDRPLTRASFSSMLETSTRGLTVRSFSSVRELLTAVAVRHYIFGLVVLSIGGASAAEPRVRDNIEQLIQALREVPVVVLSDRYDIACIKEALRHGVRGYLPTTLSPAVVIEGLRLVRAGGTFVPADVFLSGLQEPRSAVASPNRAKLPTLDGLTPRQREVLEGLRQAKSNKEIASELRMQESTVKIHVRHILQKLKVANRTRAAVLASQLLA